MAVTATTPLDDAPERIVVELDPGGPPELSTLTESFAGLARYYERHFRPSGEPAPKLYVTRLESGSIIAEIAPYAVILGGIVTTMDSTMVVADFVRRLTSALRTFAEWPSRDDPTLTPPVSADDAKDLQAFIRPLMGKKGAALTVKHARFESTDGTRKVVAEYVFDEASINRAGINMDAAQDGVSMHATVAGAPSAVPPARSEPRSEVMLFIVQASAKPGRPRGRTVDRGIVPDVSDKPLPIYFLESLAHLKDRIVKGEVNPFKSAFVVDVLAQYIGSEPQAYIITNVRDILAIDDEEGDR